MALIYSLKIEDDIDILDIKKILTTAPSFSEENGEVKATDLSVYVTKPDGLSIQVIEDEFKFSPAVAISFRLNKFSEPEIIYQRFMQAIWPVLNITQGDAVVLFNGESVVLQRKKGKLYLNETDNFWFEGTLPPDQPYEFKIMSSI